MVTVIDYAPRQRENGETFFALIVQGGIEIIQSQSSSGFYATARKTSIPSTFDEPACQALVGQELPGKVTRVDCDPYDYTIQDTGEVIQLDYTYQYLPEEQEKEPTPEAAELVEEEFVL